MIKRLTCLLCLLFITGKYVSAQLQPGYSCPPNIGFETGTFSNWDCFAGFIQKDGTLNLSSTPPIDGRHTLLINSYPQNRDPYGLFPINCPNGSGYSIQLGNSTAGGQAEGVNYIFNIPADQNDYSILYNYAVVFQNPPHQPWEQPRFTSKVYDVTDRKYIDCGSFEFVASSNLPGFKLSSSGNNVYYKPWSPVTVNLSGLAGKTVRLEFTTNDCAFTQHFGYAYLDVNEDCSSGPIAGNVICGGSESVTLTAPFGFASYAWYTANFAKLLSTQNTLTIAPVPPVDTKYAVVIIPYEGSGCQDTLYTTIRVSSEPFKLNVLSEINGCASGVDLTARYITAGSSPGLKFSYFNDLNQTDYVPVPSRVTISGIYYIRGVNASGCSDMKPIKVNIVEPPNLIINDPPGVCLPVTVDITDPFVTAGSDPGLTLGYWKDAGGTVLLPNPKTITASGIYYISAVKTGSCNIIKPVEVKIGEVPNIIIHDPTGCGKVDLADTSITSGSTPGIGYTYWKDPAATVSVTDINTITTSGTYYIKATANSGCSITRPVRVTVNPLPDFIVIDPAPVHYPVQTVDLTTAVVQNSYLTFTYWFDSLTRKVVSNPHAVDMRGRYFIRGKNEFGCILIKPVNAVILPPPEPIVYAPNAFTPNNDGLNDLFKIKIIGETSIHYLKIYNRWGQLVYDNPDMSRYWNGKLNGIELPLGVYVWIMAGIDTYFKKPFSKKGVITLVR